MADKTENLKKYQRFIRKNTKKTMEMMKDTAINLLKEVQEYFDKKYYNLTQSRNMTECLKYQEIVNRFLTFDKKLKKQDSMLYKVNFTRLLV
jgi:hypothetical protein